jgi:hypothetical protein
MNMQCRSEGVKFATWEVWSQDWNLKELAGARYKGWNVRFNQILHREPHQERWQNEGQIKGFT